MPTYEYECCDCDCHFDIKQSFNDPPVAACPRCKGKALRVFHASPVIFKGSGFYVTDNRSGGSESEDSKKKDETPVKGD